MGVGALTLVVAAVVVVVVGSVGTAPGSSRAYVTAG